MKTQKEIRKLCNEWIKDYINDYEIVYKKEISEYKEVLRNVFEDVYIQCQYDILEDLQLIHEQKLQENEQLLQEEEAEVFEDFRNLLDNLLGENLNSDVSYLIYKMRIKYGFPIINKPNKIKPVN